MTDPILSAARFPLSEDALSRRRGMGSAFRALVGFAALLLVAVPSLAATAPALGNAQSFAILAGQSVTNTGNSIINGDLGVSPGNTVTGFPPGIVVPPGTIHAGDALAASAQADVITAYNALAAQPCDFGPFGPTDLAGQTLPPGVYCYSSSVQNTGTVTLASTLATDVWVFKIGSTLTTGPGSSVVVTGPAQSCNVFWQVGSSATLDTTTTFLGNIIALTSISMNNGASIAGRALARNGSVTLINNTTNATACAGVPPPGGVGVFKAFSPATINPGNTSVLTITLSNTNAGVATLTANFSDILPTGLATSGAATTTCGGAAPVAAGTSVTLPTGATIPGGSIAAPGFCTVTVSVTAASAGSYVNSVPVGALQTNLGASPAVAGVALSVVEAFITPTLTEWAMVLLASLLAVAGAAAIRRRAR